MIARLLNAFTKWALSRNAPGSYAGEDDKRWAYTIETNGNPYLTRVLLSRMIHFLRDHLNVGVYLHHFHRPDVDQHLHNHPWSWTKSLVLSGAYVETRLVPNPDPLSAGGKVEIRVVGRTNSLTKDDYHKVDLLCGDVWTLFIVGPRVQDWGFLVEGEHVPWRKYLGISP